MQTYCVDSQVADSACSATAYLCGVKGNLGTIGVTAKVSLGQCAPTMNESTHVDSILRWSQLKNKRTGIVTSTRVTHASPAGKCHEIILFLRSCSQNIIISIKKFNSQNN